jgi:nicotinamide mononucleotide transporter
MYKNFGLFVLSLVIASIITPFTYWVGYQFGWIAEITPVWNTIWNNSISYPWIKEINQIEFWALWTTYSCVFLCNYQTRWNYLIGFVSTGLYSWLFFETGTTALAVFNAYMVFSQLYGWIRWRNDDNTRPVSLMTSSDYKLHALLGFAVFAMFIAAYIGIGVFHDGLTIAQAIDTIGPIDLGLATMSGIAQFMLDNKKLENWIVWLIVDIISVPYFWYLGLPLVAFQYLFFIINAGWGFKVWLDSMHTTDPYKLEG